MTRSAFSWSVCVPRVVVQLSRLSADWLVAAYILTVRNEWGMQGGDGRGKAGQTQLHAGSQLNFIWSAMASVHIHLSRSLAPALSLYSTRLESRQNEVGPPSCSLHDHHTAAVSGLDSLIVLFAGPFTAPLAFHTKWPRRPHGTVKKGTSDWLGSVKNGF